jgi:hypothetical protein
MTKKQEIFSTNKVSDLEIDGGNGATYNLNVIPKYY